MNWIDIALVAVLAVVFPITGRYSYLRFVDRIRRGHKDARPSTYRWTIATEYVLLAAVVVAWWAGARPFVDLGWRLEADWRLAIAVVVTAGVLWMLRSQLRAVTSGDTDAVSSFRRALGGLEDFVPHDRHELRWWIALSITAGVCEEVIYRGYLMGILAEVGGPWLAVPASSVIFGLAHSYQGPKGMARVTLVGLFMAAFYLVTGSLWGPIVVHAVGDVANGIMAHRMLARDRDRPEDREAAIQRAGRSPA